MRRLTIQCLRQTYEVLIGLGLLDQPPKALLDFMAGRGTAIVTDRGLPLDHVERVYKALKAQCKMATVLHIKKGEQAKDMNTVLELAQELARLRFDRADAMVALGGGTVLDIAGFVSAIYMRGIPYVNIPTTALAQADACIGGKVGINFGGGKNLLGSFYHPSLVMVDPSLVQTQTMDDLRSGLAEVAKAAIIGDKGLFAMLEHNAGALLSLKDPAALEDTLYRALRVKAIVVQEDEIEAGPRMKLNLGHTIGHALELLVKDQNPLAHGDAVAVGMMVASEIALNRGWLCPGDYTRIMDLLHLLAPAEHWKDLDSQAVVTATGLDKKRRAGVLHVVLPLEIGHVKVVSDVTEQELIRAIERVKGHGP